MKHSFLYDTDALLLVIILFIVMLLTLYVGYKVGTKKMPSDSDNSTLLSSLLALLGLLLAFTFGMSGSRYDDRRKDMIEEANCIGTAVLRSDMYPDSIKQAFQKDFKKYVSARVDYFEAGRDEQKINAAVKKMEVVSAQLWQRANHYSFSETYRLSSMLMIPALNSMFDIASTVNVLNNSTVPDSIMYLLFLFSIVSAFFIGYNAGVKKAIDTFLVIGFCVLTCIVIYIVLDLDRPRRGVISQENEIQLLRDLMK